MSDLSCPKIARLAGYSSRQIQRLAESGQIPNAYRTKGDHWRFTDDETLGLWICSAKKLRSAPKLPRKKPRSDNYVVHQTRLLSVLRKTLFKMDDDEVRAFIADTEDLYMLLKKVRSSR
ncbi:hypothetical protein N9269_00620 [Akkermansiaceae bacterium]|nr:hypothetical protein [Akkermansiaceae bacterium]MDB4498781.1 hypothetical protein [bacterium]MDB4764364.1 hypothetical protein [Akkermansiaceae bacterium]